MDKNHGTDHGTDHGAGRGAVAWGLAFLVYLFLVANSLFTGMFAELEDRAAYSYRPDTGTALTEQAIALLVTVGPLTWAALRWRAGSGVLRDLGDEERLIAQLLIALVSAAALRSALTLALRLDTAASTLETLILVLQILASLGLIGGGLRLVLRGTAEHDEG